MTVIHILMAPQYLYIFFIPDPEGNHASDATLARQADLFVAVC